MESDVDCGGAICPPCANGKMCLANLDCQMGNCAQNVCANAPTCMDHIKNGMETDVDCGGPNCAPCAIGKMCLAASDCTTSACVNKVCIVPASCMNNIRDGLETDVDCGGGVCPRCASGKMCKAPSDCQSNTCAGNTCVAQQAANCMDGIQNGGESDVDCGGIMCPRCAAGKMCFGNNDCASSVCKTGVCAP